jgi:hypothetical protein
MKFLQSSVPSCLEKIATLLMSLEMRGFAVRSRCVDLKISKVSHSELLSTFFTNGVAK